MSATRLPSQPGNFLAKERKKTHDNSKYVFPKIPDITRDMILQHQLHNSYASSYSIDYAKKNGKPAVPRPCSATRRNRPHPSKNFLNWRLPSELVPTLNPTDDPAFTKWNPSENLQKFYEEFAEKLKQKDGKLFKNTACSPIPTMQHRQRLLKREEVETLRLTDQENVNASDIKPPVSPVQLPRPHGHGTVGKDSTTDLSKWLGNDVMTDRDLLKEMLDANDKRYLVKFLRALTPETLMGLKKWLQARDEVDDEDDVIDSTRCPPIPISKNKYLNQEEVDNAIRTPPSTPSKDETIAYECTLPLCLKSDAKPSFCRLYGNTPSEERKIVGNLIEAGDRGYLEKFLDKMVRPGAIKGIQSWLVTHDEKDREIALRFLGDISKPSSWRWKKEKAEKETSLDASAQRTESHVFKKVKAKRRPSHGKNCSCSVCDNDRSNRILKALSRQGTSAIIDEMRKALDYVPRSRKPNIARSNKLKYKVPKLGGEASLGRNTYPASGFVANKGALFMQPHRICPSHFVIHPELP